MTALILRSWRAPAATPAACRDQADERRRAMNALNPLG